MEDQLAGPTSQLEAPRTKCSPLPDDLTELRHYSCGECSQPPGQGVGNQWRRQVTALPGCDQREGGTHPVFKFPLQLCFEQQRNDCFRHRSFGNRQALTSQGLWMSICFLEEYYWDKGLFIARGGKSPPKQFYFLASQFRAPLPQLACFTSMLLPLNPVGLADRREMLFQISVAKYLLFLFFFGVCLSSQSGW